MSSMTPFFSITASSSFFTSSKVKPYWKPEQPPPVTNTRSLSSGLPSSSISCLTLFAALSLNTSGEGISVTAFISSHSWIRFSSSARGELQLDPFDVGDVVHQPALDHRPLVDFDALVVHIAFDLRPRLEFERLGGVDGPVDRAVDHDVRGLHFAIDARIGRHHQRARLVRQGGDIAADHAVNAQTAAENHVAFDARRHSDQAIDPVLRLARLVEHLYSLRPRQRLTLFVARGWFDPISYTRTWTLSTFAFGLTLKVPSTLRKYLKANRKAAAPASPGSGKLMIALCPPSVRLTNSSSRPLKSRPWRVVGVSSSSR